MKRLLIGLSLIPVLLLCVAIFIVGTESGLRFALWQAEMWAPDTVSVESVDGKLTGPLDISGLMLTIGGQNIQMSSLSLLWKPTALFSRELTVDKLSVDGIDVTLAQPPEQVAEEPTEPFTLPEQLALPVSAILRDITFTNIQIKTATEAEPLQIAKLALNIQYQRETDDIAGKVLVESDLLNATLSLDATARDEYPINSQIDWSVYVPEVASVDGKTSIGGTINALTIEQSVAKPYAFEADVVLSDALTVLSIDAHGQIDIEKLNAIKADLPGIGIHGDFSLSGESSDVKLQSNLRFDGDLPGAINSTLSARYSQQIATIDSLEISVDDQPLEFTTTGSVDLSGPKPLAILEVNWRELTWPWSEEAQLISATGGAQLQGTVDNAMVEIDTTLNETGAIKAIATLEGQNIDATADWTSLQWPLDGSIASNITGSLKVGERIDGYTLSLNTRVDTPQLSDVFFSANGAGTQQSLQLPVWSLKAADGTLAGDLNLTWAPALSFNTSLNGKEFDPGVFMPDFPGNLSIALDAQGETVDEALVLALDTFKVTGNLREQPINASAKALLSGTDVTIDTLDLGMGDTSLRASGTVSNYFDISFEVDSPNLSELLPDAQGSLIGQGKLMGSRLEPTLDVDLAGRSLAYKEFSVESLDLKSDLDTKANGPVELELSLSKGVLPALEIESFSVDTSGRVDEHTIGLSAQTSQGDVDLSVSGSFADKQWRYTMESATLDHASLPAWRLEQPASGLVSAENQSINKACFVSQGAQACATAENTTDALTANYALTEFALSTINRFMPEGIVLSGLINSEGDVKIPSGSDPEAEFSATLNRVGVDMENSDGDTVRLLTVEPGEITGALSDTGVSVNALIDLGEQGELEAYAVIAGSVDALQEGALSGRINGTLESIAVAEQLVPILEDVQGRIVMDMTLGGSLSKLALNGELALNGGNVALAEPGIVISNAAAQITADGSSQLSLSVAADSNEGSIRVDGSIDLSDLPTPVVNLTVKGEQFQVLNTLEAEAVLSPDLLIQYDNNGLLVDGEVEVPVLAITPKKVPAGVVVVSDDQQVLGEEIPEAASAPVDVRANVKIVLGDDVFIDAFGLNAALQGALAIKESPGKETTATGQLNIVDGRFKAYGQNLVIEKGNIIYAGGPIAKPGFDIDAVRKVTSELQVGIRARGALADPQLSLFSTPPMSESEQMSYLILGRPLQDNTPSENSAMRQAAMALGVAGGKLLTEKFGDKLGLDQVAIDSELRETGEQAALVVGKYLSPRLFVSYGIGLFEPVSTLKLDYTINRNIKLISETTESKSGGDIVFTFEGGK